MLTEKRVSVFDIALPEQRAEFEELVNSNETNVKDVHDMPMATGAILRVVDYVHKEKPKLGEFAYIPPVC